MLQFINDSGVVFCEIQPISNPLNTGLVESAISLWKNKELNLNTVIDGKNYGKGMKALYEIGQYFDKFI
ncbi:MAG: hypothetical protein KUL78_03240 [Flavobacterium sp.]|nr:hypothetical protein [Flavobacterium sp.]